jgi:hypothetical protein
MHLGLHEYEQQMVLPRERFAISPGLTAILSPTIDPALLELFLVHFCAMGVHMTEPVEGWICRAGARCVELGLEALGISFAFFTHVGCSIYAVPRQPQLQ